MGGRSAGRSAIARRVDARRGIAEEVEFMGGPDHPLFGCRHVPTERPARRLGVVICSPILTDFGANYQREVALARRLAAEGVCVQRFHPRGLGHSSGERLDVTMTTLIDDARTAVDRLFEACPVDEVALVGTRFSALAAAAVAACTSSAPLVVWEPVMRARRYFREGLRAHSVHQLKLGRPGIEDPAAEFDRQGYIDVLGIPIGRQLFETAQAGDIFAAVGDRTRPILFVQFERREGLTPEYQEAVERWAAAGFDVTTAICPIDESWWFVPDRVAGASDDVVATTASWLLDRAALVASRHDDVARERSARSPANHVASSNAAGASDGVWREYPVFVPATTGDLLAVVTEPSAGVAPTGLAVVMLRGTGWRPSSGPRRTQVRTTRELAGRGFHGVRFSYHGIAESGGDHSEVVRLDRPYAADARAVAGWVVEQGLRPVLVGNCFGARSALAHAAGDETVAGLILLVPPVHDFQVSRRLDRRPLSHFARRLSPGHMAAVFGDRTRRQALRRTSRALLEVAGQRVRRRTRPATDDAAAPAWVSRRLLEQLEAVVERDVPVLFVYGEDDPYFGDFERARADALGRLIDRPGARVRVDIVPGRVHGLTGHATQEAVLAAIVDWVTTEPTR